MDVPLTPSSFSVSAGVPLWQLWQKPNSWCDNNAGKPNVQCTFTPRRWLQSSLLRYTHQCKHINQAAEFELSSGPLTVTMTISSVNFVLVGPPLLLTLVVEYVEL